MIDQPSALAAAVDAAKAAGAILLSYAEKRHELTVRTKSSPRDLLSEADEAAQREIIRIIQSRFPDHRFLAEEEGADDLGDPNSPYQWIIDPLDGTKNFLRGREDFGTIIALTEQDESLVGVIYRPISDELFQAVRGGGTFLNGKPVTLRATKNLDEAFVCMNFFARAQERAGDAYSVWLPVCGAIENYHCAAEAFAQVLRGNIDGMSMDQTRAWDVVAGALLVQEAGGKARTVWADPSDKRGVMRCVAATPPIYDALSAFEDRYYGRGQG